MHRPLPLSLALGLALASGAVAQDRPLRPDVSLVVDDKNTAFRSPVAVAVDAKNGEIYVADQEGNSVYVLGPDGKEKARFVIPSPLSVALDSKGRLYVANIRGEIGAYDFRGRKEADIVLTGLPEGAAGTVALRVAVDESDQLYVLDTANKAVVAATPEGKFLRSFGAIGEGAKGTKFVGPNSFWVARARVYVVDGGTSQVTVFSRTSGEFLFRFGERGGGRGKLARPVSIAADTQGRICVLDTVRHCISIFDEEGTFVDECGGEGSLPGWFHFPNTITRDAKGSFYVCEVLLRRVQVFTIPTRGKNGGGK